MRSTAGPLVTFLVPADPGTPKQRAVKSVSVSITDEQEAVCGLSNGDSAGDLEWP